MLSKVSDYLREVAANVEPKRRALVNKFDVEGKPIEPETAEEFESDLQEETQGNGKPGAPMVPGQTEEPPRPTASPDQRAPRRKRTHQRKWNPDTRKPLMRGYMQEYRGTGAINERKPQTRGA